VALAGHSEEAILAVLALMGWCELFGESGFFGHGPIMHKKVFEVPFLEGKVR